MNERETPDRTPPPFSFFTPFFVDSRLSPEIEKQAREIPLLKAIDKNNLSEVRQLIESGVDINLHTPGAGKTPLHMAVGRGYEKIVLTLIDAKADVNSVTQNKTTPLHVAAQQGNDKLIPLLIKAGSNVNACSDVGCTPLHEAAAKGHKQAVIILLALKADPNIKDSRYYLTAANLAHENNYPSVRDILVEAMSYQQSFVQNINYVLFKQKRACLPSSLEYQFLHTLASTVGPLEDADEVFRKIRTALTSPAYEHVKEKLQTMRHLMIANMNQYNVDKREAIKEAAEQKATSSNSV